MNRILLVGGSPAGLSLSRTLGGLGFGVDVAADGRVGLSFAEKRSYSHVLIDNELMEGNACRLFRDLKDRQQNVVGVLVTAIANLNTVYAAVESGMRQVLAKPIDYDQLLPLLDPSTATSDVSFSEAEIAALSLVEIHEALCMSDLITIIRSVDYPFAGKHRLEHFDRDTLERVVHLISRWCRQRQRRDTPYAIAG